ncbi:hypothetical protein GJG85_26510 [Burkholderia sp. MS389]|nr:hypothetical protein GJG85_26510 [Burkholderia sp. MS389]
MRCNSTAVTIGVIVVNRMMIAHERCRMADLKATFAAARTHDAPRYRATITRRHGA